MTLREALLSCNLNAVYRLINKKDRQYVAKCDRHTLKETIAQYEPVVLELLTKPITKAYSLSWMVQESIDRYNNTPYADVCFFNPKYVAPPEGAKPWGGSRGKKIPAGHYNCNLSKYNRTFAAGFVPWSKIIDTPIINEAGYPLERLVAEILWEITFYGWTEEKVMTKVDNIMEQVKDAKKEIKSGNYTELVPAKKKKLKNG